MPKKTRTFGTELIEKYIGHLEGQERAAYTIRKYRHDLTALRQWLAGAPLSKEGLIKWKKSLTARYAAASVNSMLAAVNGFLRFMEWQDFTVKPLKVQKSLFSDENRELTKEEYFRLVEAARSGQKERLALVLQTICATGIRVSELKYITAEAARLGRTEVCNKGKRRIVFLPGRLCRLLKQYLQKERRTAGAVFVTRTGKPLDRSNIWREMKKLCAEAGVEADKVFPHSLRHLFARTYYSMEKDISRLADILGHSNVSTTRIYTMESGSIHARQMGKLGLIIT